MAVGKRMQIRPILAVLIAVIALALSARAGERVFTLTILHTNDFHGADYAALARRAAMIERIRAKGGNVLLLDAGDVWTRGPHAEAFHGEPEFAALNAMSYDALTLGNNEFKGSAEPETAKAILFARIAQASFPCLCANITPVGGAAGFPGVRPFIVKEIGGLRIAILGLTSAKVALYDQAEGFAVTDPLAAAKQIVPQAAERADLVMALTHIGLRNDMRLARSIPGLAAIVGGDSHLPLHKALMVRGVPIVQAGAEGRFLGRLDLRFEQSQGVWSLDRARGRLIRLDGRIEEDAEIKALLQRYLAGRERPAA